MMCRDCVRLPWLHESFMMVGRSLIRNVGWPFPSCKQDPVVTRIEIPGEGDGVCPHCNGESYDKARWGKMLLLGVYALNLWPKNYKMVF